MDIITRLLFLTLCGSVAGEPLGRLLARRRDAFEVYAREFTRDYSPYMFAAIPLHAPVPVLRVLSRAPLQPLQRARDAQPASSAQHAAYARPYLSAPHYPQPAPHYQHPAPDQTRFYPHVQHYAEPQYSEPARQDAQSTRHRAKPARPYAAEQDYEASLYDYERPTYYQKPRRQVAPAAAAYEYAAEYDSYAPQLQLQPSPLAQLTYAIAAAPHDADAYGPHPQEAAPTVLYARPSPSGGYTYRRVPEATAPPPPPPKKKASAPLKEKEKNPPYILKIHKYRIVKDDLI